MSEKRYREDMRVRSPPVPSAHRSKERQCTPPRRICEDGLQQLRQPPSRYVSSVLSDAERSRRTERRRSVSAERRDFDRRRAGRLLAGSGSGSNEIERTRRMVSRRRDSVERIDFGRSYHGGDRDKQVGSIPVEAERSRRMEPRRSVPAERRDFDRRRDGRLLAGSGSGSNELESSRRIECRRRNLVERIDFDRSYNGGDRDGQLSLGSVLVEAERSRRGMEFRRSGSVERRDYEKHYVYANRDTRALRSSGLSEVERSRSIESSGVSAERRDYDKRHNDADRDGRLGNLSQFNEGLPHGDSFSGKFHQKQLLDEPAKNFADYSSKYSIGHDSSAINVFFERDFQRNRYSDLRQSGALTDKPHISVGSDMERIYIPCPPEIGISKSSSNADGGSLLPSRNLRAGLYSYEDDRSRDVSYMDNLVTSKPVEREPYREDKLPLPYSMDPDYLVSSSNSKAFLPVSMGLSKDFSHPFKEGLHAPADGLRLGTGMIVMPIGLDGYDQQSYTRYPVINYVRPSDLRNYSQPYLSQSEGKYGVSTYQDILRSDHGSPGMISNELSGKMSSFREDYGHLDLLRTGILDPVVEKINNCSRREHLGESRQWDYHPTSRGQFYDYIGSTGLLHPEEQLEDGLGYENRNPGHEKQVYRDHENLCKEECYPHHQSDSVCWSHEQGLESLPTTTYDPCLKEFEQLPTSRELDLVEVPDSELKRKRGMNKKLSRLGDISSNEKTIPEIYDQENDEDVNAFYLSKKSRRSQSWYGKFGRKSRERTIHGLINSDNLTSSGTVSESMQRHSIRSHKSPSRGDIKQRLGPGPLDFRVSQCKPLGKRHLGSDPQKLKAPLPWLKNQKSQNFRRNQDNFNESFLDKGGSPGKGYVTPPNCEPPENSEDFKQLVHSAFFKFVKQLNENPSQKSKFMEKGTDVSLKCSICGSDSEEFPDTQSLVEHAFTFQKVGCRSQHLGLYRALCTLMGWKSANTLNCPWVCEQLSQAESLAVKEDLIIWPPVVIVHNSSIGNSSYEQVIVSTEALESLLQGMGFGDKTKVCLGKPANQSIMVVRFSGTFSGLQEAERLHKIYAKTKRGRAELQLINPSNNKTDTGETHEAEEKVENVLYGYLGIAEDLDKLDFETKRRCLVKSKKEIQDIADAPLIN